MQRQRLPASQKRISCSVGFGFCVEQRLGGDEEAGRADAALQRGVFEERLLQRVQAVRRWRGLRWSSIVGALDLDAEDAGRS